WAQKMASANEAQVNDYKGHVKHLERTLRKQRESADREMAIHVRIACEITRLKLYSRAKKGSTMYLLGQLEEAQRRNGELEKELGKQTTVQDDPVAEGCRAAPTIAEAGTQTEEFYCACPAAAALEAQARLSEAESELHSLGSRLEESQSHLVSELQARKGAEASAERALDQLDDVQQRLSTQVAQQEGLERQMEELQRAHDDVQEMAAESNCKLEQVCFDLQERQLALDELREQLDHRTEALSVAEQRARVSEHEAKREAVRKAATKKRAKAISKELKESRRLTENVAESQQEAELHLKAVQHDLESCHEELLASEQSRKAAMASVETKEEELCSMHQALESSTEKHADKKAAKENCPRRTRRTTRNTRRATRATRAKAGSVAPSDPLDSEAAFNTPSLEPRLRCLKAGVPPKNALEEEQDFKDHRAVLADDNAESSSLTRFGNFMAGMLFRGPSSSVAAGTLNQCHPVTTDANFVELCTERPASTRRTNACRQAKE
ncbi:flagellar attachment zone protein 1-like, partial [Dermacentor silvarum]|uniref:flagellar attachment zone protein 1-like n=1 Tax=Dermacentor silvarum TaxID=543639 RepID=UPI0021019350